MRVVSIAAAALALAPALATASPVSITSGTAVVTAGRTASFAAATSARWCRIEAGREGGRRSHGRALVVPARRFRVMWKVPRDARSGRYVVGLRCGKSRRAARRGRLASFALTVRGGRGRRSAIPTWRLRLTVRPRRGPTQAPPPSAPNVPAPAPANDPFERFNLTDRLPEGVGNPDEYAVDLPPGIGGGGFDTYWPLAQGTQARITQSAGGRASHYTPYTQDAIDLGLPAETELRAGFTGVVARVNRGCPVGNYDCGSGYGNYIYLKAADGSCALLAHMTRVDVSPGQQVPRYTLLGTSGTTGNSSGPHLHYNHVNCSNNRSMPWAPLEGGSLAETVVITSQNHPEGPPPTQPTQPTQPSPPQTWAETTGGVTHTWTNYVNAGGTEGPTIGSNQTVQIACKLQGFRVANGNTWWYRIAQAPWNGNFYASADAFYNNGQTSGSLRGTPWVDGAVRDC